MRAACLAFLCEATPFQVQRPEGVSPAPATKESNPSERRLFLCLLNRSSFVLSILPNSCLGDRSS